MDIAADTSAPPGSEGTKNIGAFSFLLVSILPIAAVVQIADVKFSIIFLQVPKKEPTSFQGQLGLTFLE